MQNNNYVWYKHNEEKKEKKPEISEEDTNYLLTILGAIFMVECIVMLGIVLSALWFIEYGGM